MQHRSAFQGVLPITNLYQFSYNDKVSIIAVNHEHLPLYPDTANHVIDSWCWSIRSHYTSLYHAEYSKDENGEFSPPELRCVVSNSLLRNPHYFQGCRSLNGRAHYYDKTSIDMLKLQVADTIPFVIQK